MQLTPGDQHLNLVRLDASGAKLATVELPCTSAADWAPSIATSGDAYALLDTHAADPAIDGFTIVVPVGASAP